METREEHYESMMQAVKRYSPAADLDVIQRAFEYADEKHKKQLILYELKDLYKE